MNHTKPVLPAAVLRKRKPQAQKIHDILLAAYGPQKCCLDHATPFQLLCATILSAQCTDKRVNMVTPALFKRWPGPAELSKCRISDLEKAVHECGFYHAKAANLKAASCRIMEEFGGELPRTMEELTTLPGVGRKTANVVLGDAFGVPGLPVDTHVRRLAALIGLTESDDPEQIEAELCAMLPPELWAEFSHLIIIHGRTRCPARRPDCENCEIRSCCAHGSHPAAASKLKRKKS